MAKRVTTSDIASRTGFHQTTVSRALKNHPGLPKATCQTIQKAAKEMGYVPDPTLSALMRYRKELQPASYHGLLAVVSNRPKEKEWRENQTGKDYFRGLLKQAKKLGYQIEEFGIHPQGIAPSQFHRMTRARNIKGVILCRLHPDSPLPDLNWKDYSVVSVGSTVSSNPFNRVGPDLYRSSFLLMEKLIDLGYRHFGQVVLRDTDDRMENANSAGLYRAKEKWGRSIKMSRYLPELGDWNYEKFKKWMTRVEPEVVLSSHAELPIWLKRMGRRVPKDVGLVRFNCDEEKGSQSGIFQNLSAVGEAAIVMLSGMLECNQTGVPKVPQRLLVEGSWVRGKTVRRLEVEDFN